MRMVKSILASSLFMMLPLVSAQAQTVLKADSATVAEWITRADNGDAVAQNKVGIWYYTGVGGLEKDYVTAVKYWTLAAKQNNDDAIGNLAMCYQLGNGVEADSLTASKLYINAITKGNTRLLEQHQRLADKGKLFSIMLLYDIYNNGRAGQQRNQEKALQLLIDAANKDNTEAQTKLALIYLNGKKPAEAVSLFKVLAEKDIPMGNYYYGYLLYKGMGVEQNKLLAITYLQRAAESGFDNAHRLLGQIYYNGDGVAKQTTKAIDHLTIAAKAGIGESQFLLAKCYVKGDSIAADYDVAAHWLGEAYAKRQDSAVKAYIDSMALFKTYLQGLQAFYDSAYTEAATSFKAVEEAGRSEGLTMQARCLMAPDNEKRNDKKAFKMMSKAAKSHLLAQYYLATMYRQGIGTKADELKSEQLTEALKSNPMWVLPFNPDDEPVKLKALLKNL